MDAKTRHELHQLLSNLADSGLDDAAEQRLGDLLGSSSEARDLYLAHCDLHLDLALRTAPGASQDGLARPLFVPGERAAPAGKAVADRGGWTRPGWFSWPLAPLVAAAAVLLVAFGFWANRPPAPVPTVGRLVEQREAVWAAPQLAPDPSRPLVSGPLELRAGLARLEMASGAVVTLRGRVSVELLDPKAIRIVQGRVTVSVPEEAIGFRALTPTADVVDLGTEFAIAVDDAGATEVHVARGVVVARPLGGEGIVPLRGREAARIDGRLGDLGAIEFDDSWFPEPRTKFSVSPRTLPARPSTALPDQARIVFLGDRATDRETHLLLVARAAAGLEPRRRPKLFNAGVTFPLSFQEDDFQRLIVPLRPTHAVLEFGSEIAADRRPRSVERFRDDVLRLVDRLEGAGIEPILETGFPLGAEHQAAGERLNQYNRFLRDLAERRGYRLVDAEAAFREAAGSGRELLTPDGVAPTFAGHRLIAGELLAAFGFPGRPLDDRLEVALLPGALKHWRYRFKTSANLLDAAAAGALRPDGDWLPLELPQTPDHLAERMADRWHSITYRDRTRGFATNLWRRGAEGIEAMTTVESSADRDAVINIGATVRTVWLNDEKIYDSHGRWTGWHAGKERIPARLKAGENTILVEAGTSFFVSITDRLDWSLTDTCKIP